MLRSLSSPADEIVYVGTEYGTRIGDPGGEIGEVIGWYRDELSEEVMESTSTGLS